MNPPTKVKAVVANVTFRYQGQNRIASRLFDLDMPISALVKFIETQVGHYASTNALQLSEYTGSSAPTSTKDVEQWHPYSSNDGEEVNET